MIHVIEIQHHAFHPDELTIEVGDSVKWHNLDGVRHSARRDDNPDFDTGLISGGRESDEIEFTAVSPAAGLSYFCEPHPHMAGVIIVVAANRNSDSRLYGV